MSGFMKMVLRNSTPFTLISPQASQTHDSRNRSNVLMIYACTRIERDVTALSARCYVTQRAVENLSALQGIVRNLKQRRI